VTHHDPDPGQDSVLAGLTPRIGQGAAANYDLTRQLLIRVLGLQSARRAEVEQAEPVNSEALNAVAAAQARTADLLRNLDPADTERVAQVRADCVELLREAGAT
jgi:hypothetical protein